MNWLLLSLLSAFSLASTDAATKRYLSMLPPTAIVVVRFLGVAIVLLPLLLWQPWPTLPMAFWAWLAIMVPLEILSMNCYMEAIRSSPLARTLPYLAFTPVCATVTGLVVLGEKLSLHGLLGIALITAGAYALNIDQLRQGGRWQILAPLTLTLKERGPRLMLASAAIYSVTSVIGKQLLSYTSPLFFGPFYSLVLGVITATLLYRRTPAAIRDLKARPLAVALVATLASIEAVSHYLAIQQVEVAYMLAVKRTSLLFGIVYGALLFREAHLTRHFIAGVIMVIGVAVLVIGT
jgi:drug/metabolite transporter (DMT)-like permease